MAVGAVVRRGDELLLVQRGRGVAAGQWSLPGGRVEMGEHLVDAVVREVAEETAVAVEVTGFLGLVERMGEQPAPYHYVILDYAAVPADPGAEPRAGDDAADARWVPLAAVAAYDLVAGLADFLVEVGVALPQPPR